MWKAVLHKIEKRFTAVSCVEMAEVTSEGMRFVDNYRGSTLVRAR